MLLRATAQPLDGSLRDYDGLLEQIGDARFVLIGEATHGSHEFYRERAIITKRLIRERAFNAVAVEADFPDAFRINRYVKGRGQDRGASEALAGFKRFPTWMWRNADVLDFVGWLAELNRGHERPVGFYGLDLYSLYSSIAAILSGLERLDPEAARRARERYSCFDHFRQDAETYGYATGLGAKPDCEQQVTQQLVELLQRGATAPDADGDEADFCLAQNARVVKSAEQYYRSMFRGRARSWNLRDQHMLETLAALAEHLERDGKPAKIVVWAHNSHLGDARFTGMAALGEHNLGQLVRERFPGDAFLLGFSTYTGTVSAASDWDGPAERKAVRPGLPNSYEALFHETRLARFLLDLRDPQVTSTITARRLQRAIGVVYRPETERQSHYFEADVARQFDALIHIDHTRAVEPLEVTTTWSSGEPPETYPFAV
jgi:erythromycin esterase-like protein